MRGKLNSAIASLQVRNYRLFATGQMIKLVGAWMMFTAQDWLVLQLTDDSATALGAVTALQFAPVLLLSLYGGTLADRFDKRKLLAITNIVWLVLAVVQAVLVVTGAVQLWHVFVFAAALGVQGAIETPARQAFVSELVGNHLLPNALALSAATFNSARVVGPALAGLVIAVWDTGGAFVVSAVAAIAPVVTYRLMRSADLFRDPPAGKGARPQAKIMDGLRYVAARPDLLLPMGLIAVIGMIGFNFTVTLAVLAKTVFAAGPASFGLLTTALATGALAGALAGSGRRARPSVYLVLGAAMAFGALETVVGFAPSFLAAALLLLPTGFFMILFAQAANQRVQMGTAAAYRGRVMALYVVVFLGTTPVGALLVGWIAEHIDPGASIWLGGVGSALAAAVGLLWKLHRTGERLRVRLLPIPRFSVVQQP
ncbi:MFS transporter [Pilimelia columellifera]|uniref:MFS transporter n=1 Tax=Pilimelia columellifera subsp. columellifera TaxID=706583 RepID=A0ABP6A4H4_9ACTN